jgi:chromosome segregation ATPase
MKRLKMSLVLLALLLSFSVSFQVGQCSEITYQMTEEQLTTLETQLTMLDKNNKMLLMELDESRAESQQAKDSLESSKKETEALRQQLIESNKIINELQNQLSVMKKDSAVVKSSLEIANQELANASKSFKEYEQQTNRKINILTMQRNGWEAVAAVLAAGLIGVAVS